MILFVWAVEETCLTVGRHRPPCYFIGTPAMAESFVEKVNDFILVVGGRQTPTTLVIL